MHALLCTAVCPKAYVYLVKETFNREKNSLAVIELCLSLVTPTNGMYIVTVTPCKQQKILKNKINFKNLIAVFRVT